MSQHGWLPITEWTGGKVKERKETLARVAAWPEWPAAEEKLRELGCTPVQLAEIRRGVNAAADTGSYSTADEDVAWHVLQVISVMIHQGFTFYTCVLDKPARGVNTVRSMFRPGHWLVSLSEFPPAPDRR